MTINCPLCNKLTISGEPECIECGEDISNIPEEVKSKNITMERNCIWCDKTNEFRNEAGQIDGTWKFSKLHIKILSCSECGFIHQFRELKSHFL